MDTPEVDTNQCYVDALQNLLDAKPSRVIAFFGAGASYPIYPLWDKAIQEFAFQAEHQWLTAGKGGAESRNQMAQRYAEIQTFWKEHRHSHPTFVVESMKRVLAENQHPRQYDFLLRELFSPRYGKDGHQSTLYTDIAATLPFAGCITLNFDNSIVSAFTNQNRGKAAQCFTPAGLIVNGHSTKGVITPDVSEQMGLDSWLEDTARNGDGPKTRRGTLMPILFLHGHYSSPNSIVFGSKEYFRVYRESHAIFLKRLFSEYNVVFFGFGFTDNPICAALSEAVIEGKPCRHFALKGAANSGHYAEELRKLYQEFFGTNLLLYTIKKLPDGSVDHSQFSTLFTRLGDEYTYAALQKSNDRYRALAAREDQLESAWTLRLYNSGKHLFEIVRTVEPPQGVEIKNDKIWDGIAAQVRKNQLSEIEKCLKKNNLNGQALYGIEEFSPDYHLLYNQNEESARKEVVCTFVATHEVAKVLVDSANSTGGNLSNVAYLDDFTVGPFTAPTESWRVSIRNVGIKIEPAETLLSFKEDSELTIKVVPTAPLPSKSILNDLCKSFRSAFALSSKTTVEMLDHYNQLSVNESEGLTCKGKPVHLAYVGPFYYAQLADHGAVYPLAMRDVGEGNHNSYFSYAVVNGGRFLNDIQGTFSMYQLLQDYDGPISLFFGDWCSTSGFLVPALELMRRKFQFNWTSEKKMEGILIPPQGSSSNKYHKFSFLKSHIDVLDKIAAASSGELKIGFVDSAMFDLYRQRAMLRVLWAFSESLPPYPWVVNRKIVPLPIQRKLSRVLTGDAIARVLKDSRELAAIFGGSSKFKEIPDRELYNPVRKLYYEMKNLDRLTNAKRLFTSRIWPKRC